jgi:hypothetical protein
MSIMLQIFDIDPQHKFKKGHAIGKFKKLGEKELCATWILYCSSPWPIPKYGVQMTFAICLVEFATNEMVIFLFILVVLFYVFSSCVVVCC